MKLQYSFLLLLLVALNFQANAQQREGEIDYERELIGGINFNTNGGLIGGFMLRYSRLLYESKTQFHNFGLEVAVVKHHKEIRYAAQQSGSSFIAYKKNHMVVIRPSYGREFVLLNKGNKDGVQLDLLLNGGLSFGVLTPYYIDYQTANGPAIVPYDPVNTPNVNQVINSAGYTSGLAQSKIVPGVHFKTGFSFEYSHFTNNVTGVEVGFLLEAFTQKMVIMQAPANSAGYFKNNQFFSSVYVTIFYGGRK